MATLNFPDPNVTPTYTDAGITWTYNATLGVWSSDLASSGGAGGDDTRYLRLDAAAPAQTRASTNATAFNCDVNLYKNLTVDVLSTFKGLTTHEAGVRVTGGDVRSTGSEQISKIRATGSLPGDNALGGGYLSDLTSLNDTAKVNGYNCRILSDLGSGNIAGYQQFQIASDIDGYDGNMYAFFANGNTTLNSKNRLAAGRRLAGFYSNYGTERRASDGNNLEPLVDADGNANVYNFYAAGDAPNYFAGLTEHAGGVKSRFIEIFSSGNSSRYNNRGLGFSNSGNTIDLTNHPPAVGDNCTAFQAKVSTRDDSGSTIAAGILTSFRARNHTGGSATYTGAIGLGISNLSTAGDSSNAGWTGDIDVYGIHSDIASRSVSGKPGQAYNFYASGNAPNFWAGYNLYNGFSKDWSWLSTQLTGIRLGVRSNLSSNAQFEIATNRHVGGDANIAILFTAEKSDSDASKEVKGAIRIDNTGVSYEETSDYRLKENIQPIANASELINQLNPSTYQFKSEPSVTCHGFLAHELQAVLPKAVSGTKDATEAIGTLADYDGTVLKTEVAEPEELEYTEEVETDGVATMVTRTRSWTPTGTRPIYQGVDVTKLVPLLTKALQEALTRIETLEADVASLQNP